MRTVNGTKKGWGMFTLDSFRTELADTAAARAMIDTVRLLTIRKAAVVHFPTVILTPSPRLLAES